MRGAGLAQPLNLLRRTEPEKPDKLSILPRGQPLYLVKSLAANRAANLRGHSMELTQNTGR